MSALRLVAPANYARKASLGLAFLICTGLITVPVHADPNPKLVLGQAGTTLSGTATLTNLSTTATGTYQYFASYADTIPVPLDPTTVRYSTLHAYGSSTVNVSGGFINAAFEYGSSTTNLSGGQIGFLNTFDSCTTTVSSGYMQEFWAYDSSITSISGGLINNLFTYGDSTTNITGGQFPDTRAYGDSSVNITGGNLAGGGLVAGDNSLINISGTGFAGVYDGDYPLYNYLDQTVSLVPVYYLTGTLQDGELFSSGYYNAGGTLEFNGVEFYAGDPPPAVPEASTTVSFGLLLALGMGGMMVAAKRKKTNDKDASTAV